MYVFMVITYSRVWINRVSCQSCLWSTGKNNISLSPFAPENLASRDGFSCPVPRQPAYSPYSGWIWCLLTGLLPISAAVSTYVFKPPYAISGQSRIYRVAQLRTDGVHCSLSMEMSRLTRDGTAEPVSRDQILRDARGQGNIHFPCSADHEQDWQPYPVDPYSCYM